MNTWKDEIEKIIANGGTDSDIEEYLYKHPGFNASEIWAYIDQKNSKADSNLKKAINYFERWDINDEKQKTMNHFLHMNSSLEFSEISIEKYNHTWYFLSNSN